MIPPMTPAVSRLRIVGLIEGVSFLLLLSVAIPRRLVADPELRATLALAVRLVGSLHGALFLLFCLLLVLALRERRWSAGRGLALFAASVMPFGTFLIDGRLKRWAAE
jgi:integral membrane protein